MKKFLLLLLLIPLSFQSNAWGVLGHRIVGEIAEQHISKKTKRQIKQLLGNESIAMASNWADFIKSDTNYRYLNTWHYVNFPANVTRDGVTQQLASDSTANAYNKLEYLVSELKNNKSLSKETKVMYLRLIIHMVGDVHQPMHAGRPEDLGGNRVQLFWFYEQSNLHRVWDEQLIDFQQLSYTEYTKAINFVTKEQKQNWQKSNAQDWLYESAQIASQLYPKVKKGDKLSFNYNFDNIGTLNNQLLKGGVRLAAVLDSIFK